MSKPHVKYTNPFYLLLVAAGIAFVMTACCYGVMMIKLRDPFDMDAATGGDGFLPFFDRHGLWLMAVELAILAAATFAAMGTDGFWARLAQRRHEARQANADPQSELP